RFSRDWSSDVCSSDLIDHFFRALGWDVDNQKGRSEAYKEVAHEDPIRIRGQTNFLDYSFRIGGVRKFIVEAKKPSVNIKDDTERSEERRGGKEGSARR